MHVGFVVVFARVSSIGFTAKTRVIYLKGIEKCSSAAHKAVRLLWKQELVTFFLYFNFYKQCWPNMVSVQKIDFGKNYIYKKTANSYNFNAS